MEKENQFEHQFELEIANTNQTRAVVLIALLGFEGVVLYMIYLFFSEQYLSLFQTNLSIYAVLIFMVVIIIHELITHYFIKKKRYSPFGHPKAYPYRKVFTEVTLLSLLLIVIIYFSKQTIILYSPAVLTYFIFIILSTLNVDYRLPVFTGIAAALEYLLVSVFCSLAGSRMGVSELAVAPIQYLGQALVMVTAGVAAGFVANLVKRKMGTSFMYLAERNDVINLFGQQISHQIAGEILKNPKELQGTKRDVCVMFLDIRDFTPYVEFKEPEEVVSYLNSLFGYMIEIVQTHHGVINQFLGDGFMATFGAPVAAENSCNDATTAALKILRKTQIDSKTGAISPTRIGIGLHYGKAFTGNIGSVNRKQYSITGEVVILSSRIEQLTKLFNLDLLLSEEVYNHLMPSVQERMVSIGPVRVKGKKEPVTIYGIDNQEDSKMEVQ